MKNKHNKKRNTAFVYEALVKEATVAVLKEDTEKRDKVISLIKKYFNNKSILSKDLDCYRSLYETRGMSEEHSRRLISEAKVDKRMIDPTGLFKLQSQMIGEINKEIDSDIFNNFVPNYKTLATIDQLFSVKTPIRNKMMLENELVSFMTEDSVISEESEIDDVVVKTFVEKFNNKYTDNLLEEQKNLLTQYISSFSDNSLSLKVYLNEEISRLKHKLNEAKSSKEFLEDTDMLNRLNQIIEKLNSYSSAEINDEVLLTVLRTQSLTKEIFSNGSND